MSKNPFSVPPMEGGGGGGVSATGGTALADNVIVRGDGTTGIQGSVAALDDNGLITSTGGTGKVLLTPGAGNPYFECQVSTQPRAALQSSGLRLVSNCDVTWANVTTNHASGRDTGLARSAAGVLKVTDGSTGLGRIVDLGSESCLGVLTGADFNVTTDQAITIAATTYIVTGIIVTNASISLDTAAGGVYTAASKGGTAVVAAAQVYSALTASTKYLSLTLEAVAGTDVFSATTLYLSLTSAQGAAATADVYVLGRRLS